MSNDPITYWDVYMEEGPFGSGRRRILRVHEGHKWSKLLYPATCETAEMLTEEFERLKPTELLLPAWNYQEMANRLQRAATEYQNNSVLYRDAMRKLGFPVPDPEPGMMIAKDGSQKEKPEPKAPKVYVPGEGEKPGQNEGSGKFIMRLWMTGSYEPQRLADLVRENYPGRTTKVSDVKYNYNILINMSEDDRQKAYGRKDVPAWPEKKAEPEKPKKGKT